MGDGASMSILTNTESKEVTPLTPRELLALLRPKADSIYTTVKLLIDESDNWQNLCVATRIDLEAMRRERDEMTQSRDHWQAIAARRIANLEHYTSLAENDIAELTRERDIAIAAQAKAERERDNAWDTCKRALHKVDDLTASAEKAEKDSDSAEVEIDDAIRTAQDNAADVEKLKGQIEKLNDDLMTARDDLVAARAILLEAKDKVEWIGCSSEGYDDMIAMRDEFIARINAALAWKGE